MKAHRTLRSALGVAEAALTKARRETRAHMREQLVQHGADVTRAREAVERAEGAERPKSVIEGLEAQLTAAIEAHRTVLDRQVAYYDREVAPLEQAVEALTRIVQADAVRRDELLTELAGKLGAAHRRIERMLRGEPWDAED